MFKKFTLTFKTRLLGGGNASLKKKKKTLSSPEEGKKLLLSRREGCRIGDSLQKYSPGPPMEFSISAKKENREKERKKENCFEDSHLEKSTKFFKNINLAKKE